jgi:hypothetical protein
MLHINQNCSSSCGPTSLKMIMIGADYKNNLETQDIFNMAPTKIGGTPWPRMSKIIRDLGIKHKVISDVSLSYFKTAPKNKVWMLSVYYGSSKHWVVLQSFIENYYLVLDPASTVKKYTEENLSSIFTNRNSLVIEFDLNDFLGESPNYESHDEDGDYVMNYIDKYQMRLKGDSNFLFNKLGKKIDSVKEFVEKNIDTDYIYGVFDYSEINSEKYIFGFSYDKVLFLRFKDCK